MKTHSRIKSLNRPCLIAQASHSAANRAASLCRAGASVWPLGIALRRTPLVVPAQLLELARFCPTPPGSRTCRSEGFQPQAAPGTAPIPRDTRAEFRASRATQSICAVTRGAGCAPACLRRAARPSVAGESCRPRVDAATHPGSPVASRNAATVEYTFNFAVPL